MNKKSITMILSFFLSVIFANAAEVIDGSWNGKPWDIDKLERGVEVSNPDALAEWAYCSTYCKNGVNFDAAKILKTSKMASAGGSALGTGMLAHCYLTGYGVKVDTQKALELYAKSKDQGHPYGYWRHHVQERIDGKVKLAEAVARMEECIENGLLEAHWSVASIYHFGQLGVIDLKKAGKHYVIGLHEGRSLEIAIKMVNFKANDGILEFIPEETRTAARKMVNDAASSDHTYCKFSRAISAMSQNKGFHQYLPDLIALAKLPYLERQSFIEPSAPSIFLKNFANTDRYSDQETKTPYLVINNMSRSAILSNCYEEGSRLQEVHSSIVVNILKQNWWQRNELPTQKEEDRAINILRGMFITFPDDHNPHHTFGDYFTEKFFKSKNGNIADFERGMTHHLYHSYCFYSMYRVAQNYCEFDKTKDLVKGAAAAQALLNLGIKDRYKMAEPWVADAKKLMTEEQRAEFEKLVEDGFPRAKKFRMPAFKKLQELGDLPKDMRFDNEEEDDGIEEEEAFYNHRNSDLRLVIHQPDSLYTPQERDIFQSYLSGKTIAEEKLSKLVSLLIEDDDKLKALLESFDGTESSDRANQLSAIMGEEYKLKAKNSPIAAELGWYVSYENKQLISAPLITRLYDQNKKCTVRTSDVLMDCYGVNLARPNSRNLFMRLVHLWHKETPLKFKVRRSGSQHPGWQGQKNTYTEAFMHVK